MDVLNNRLDKSDFVLWKIELRKLSRMYTEFKREKKERLRDMEDRTKGSHTCTLHTPKGVGRKMGRGN